MPESMTLIKQASTFYQTNPQNFLYDRLPWRKNLDVYATGLSTKSTKSRRLDKFILPSIEKEDQSSRKTSKRRPVYRTSLYHLKTSSTMHSDLSPLTARGKKPEVLTTISRDDETVMNLQRHHAPPPSPSDDQIERILSGLNRTRQSTPRLSTLNEIDGNIPYRLPTLHQSARQRRPAMNTPLKGIKSTLSNYLQAYY